MTLFHCNIEIPRPNICADEWAYCLIQVQLWAVANLPACHGYCVNLSEK